MIDIKRISLNSTISFSLLLKINKKNTHFLVQRLQENIKERKQSFAIIKEFCSKLVISSRATLQFSIASDQDSATPKTVTFAPGTDKGWGWRVGIDRATSSNLGQVRHTSALLKGAWSLGKFTST